MAHRILACFALIFTLPAPGHAREHRVDEIRFTSHGVLLAGSVVSPGDPRELRAALVFVHGSGKQTRDVGLATRFADAGIVALVYDKRGTGKSGGDYEYRQSVSEGNLSLLADDAVAATHCGTGFRRT